MQPDALFALLTAGMDSSRESRRVGNLINEALDEGLLGPTHLNERSVLVALRLEQQLEEEAA